MEAFIHYNENIMSVHDFINEILSGEIQNQDVKNNGYELIYFTGMNDANNVPIFVNDKIRHNDLGEMLVTVEFGCLVGKCITTDRIYPLWQVASESTVILDD